MSGEIIKADRDFTKEVDAALPDAEKEAQNGQVQAAVEKLLALEKQTRQSSDLASTSRVIVAIVTICKDSGDWSLLNEQVQVLSKKHGQLKQAITKMVQVVMGFLDDAMDKAQDAIAEHDDQVDDAIEKAGDIVDDKTGDKYADHIDKGQDLLQERTGEGDTNP